MNQSPQTKLRSEQVRSNECSVHYNSEVKTADIYSQGFYLLTPSSCVYRAWTNSVLIFQRGVHTYVIPREVLLEKFTFRDGFSIVDPSHYLIVTNNKRLSLLNEQKHLNTRYYLIYYLVIQDNKLTGDNWLILSHHKK